MQIQSASFRNRVASLEKIYHFLFLSLSLSIFFISLFYLIFLMSYSSHSSPLLSSFAVLIITIFHYPRSNFHARRPVRESAVNSMLYILSLLASWFARKGVFFLVIFWQNQLIRRKRIFKGFQWNNIKSNDKIIRVSLEQFSYSYLQVSVILIRDSVILCKNSNFSKVILLFVIIVYFHSSFFILQLSVEIDFYFSTYVLIYFACWFDFYSISRRHQNLPIVRPDRSY